MTSLTDRKVNFLESETSSQRVLMEVEYKDDHEYFVFLDTEHEVKQFLRRCVSDNNTVCWEKLVGYSWYEILSPQVWEERYQEALPKDHEENG